MSGEGMGMGKGVKGLKAPAFWNQRIKTNPATRLDDKANCCTRPARAL
jgi:hypothetical protein